MEKFLRDATFWLLGSSNVLPKCLGEMSQYFCDADATRHWLPYAEPFTLLSYRFVITLFFLLILIIYKKSPWPETRLDFFHLLIAGVLIHGVYLGGVFQALKWGMPAGLGAMVIFQASAPLQCP